MPTLVTEVLLLVVAIWAFAATFEPLRSRTFGRPVSGRAVTAIRVTAGAAAVLAIVALLLDVFQ